MNINESTSSFEKWLGEQLDAHGELDTAALKLKHHAMKEKGPHAFLRATFYRWAQLWKTQGIDAPKVLSVGDTHVENFGTWRDGEGRLVWGVNDFDEVCELPYTSDLVRLGVSARFALKELEDFETAPGEACTLILRGYAEAIRAKAAPFVLAENHSTLTRLAQQTFLAFSTENFWKNKLKKTQPAATFPAAARQLLESSLHAGCADVEFREPVPDDPPGLGSRGKRRFYAFAIWHGARVLREAKPVVPSAWAWATETSATARLAELLKSPNRCPDPTQQVRAGWIVRRLAPDAMKIELKVLSANHAPQADEEKLFESMGAELGRLHAGSGLGNIIAADLDKRNAQDKGWFKSAVKSWAKTVEEDQKDFARGE